MQYADKGNVNALMFAAAHGHTDTVRLLVPGSNLRQIDQHGNSALIWAAFYGHTEAARLLIAGSDLSQADNEGFNALMFSVDTGNLELFRLLIPCGEREKTNNRGQDALMLAAARGHTEMVRALIHGSDLNRVDGLNRQTALILAATNGFTETVRLLIPGSELKKKDVHGNTALKMALKFSRWDCVDLLATADPDHGLGWPEQASISELPQWHARLEQQELKAVATTTSSRPSPSTKHRL